MYLWHCREENTTPLPDNTFAHALSKIGVPKRLVPDRSTGGLRRWTVYYIAEVKPLERYWMDHGEDWNEDQRSH